MTKVPYAVTGRKASSTDSSTWSTYAEVKEAEKSGKFTGIGVVFTPDKTLLGVDIDHVLEDGNVVGEHTEAIRELVARANTLTEISPSGTGLHLYLKLTDPLTLTANRHAPFEAYTSGRFFTFTENHFAKAKPIRAVTIPEAEQLLSIIGYPWRKEEGGPLVVEVGNKPKPSNDSSLVDEALLKEMFGSKHGVKLIKLYNGDITDHENDVSRADMAFCMHLAFWTKKDAVQMERIWLASGLGNRAKTQQRSEYRQRTIAAAIAKCTDTIADRTKKVKKEKNESPADLLLKSLLSRKDLTLFHDEFGSGHISLDVGGHQEIWGCKSQAIKMWLSSEGYRIQESVPSSEALRSVLSVLEGKACFDGPKIKLHNRVAWHDGELWYDLTNDSYQAIKINANGWEIIDNVPIIFKRYNHHKAQVTPVQNGDARLLLKYVNITNPEHRLLLLVSLIGAFIPDFPHPILVIFGSQGSSKSTMSKQARLVVDPSTLDVVGLPEKHELVQILAHHHFVFFDNVSYVSEEISDILCKAITGSGFSKRQLYTDDEDIIHRLQRCIGLNGINLVTLRPDLLERSLLLELERIEDAKRRNEQEMYDEFNKDLPCILGGIFDVLVRTIKIRPEIKLASSPRMADFAIWGSAIAEALGHTKEEFLTAYQNNISRQSEMLVNENIVATALITFMEDQEGDWKDTPTELLKQLTNHAAFALIDTREKYWPKGAGSLSRRLNELGTYLKNMGLLVTISTSGKSRWIEVKKISKNTPADDTDGVSG